MQRYVIITDSSKCKLKSSLQLYFAALIYSYAVHLRKGTYRSLPLSGMTNNPQYIALTGSARAVAFPETFLGDEDEETADDFYQRSAMPTPHPPHSANRTPGAGSISSFADFVSAPGRSQRFRPVASAGVAGSSRKTGVSDKDTDFVEEVLFDSDELGHSRFGTTEESTSVSSREDN